MPKDATKNIDRYKIRGGSLNEFEYAENQAALAEQKPGGQANLIPGTPPEQKADGLHSQAKGAAKKTTKKSGKATKSTKSAKASKKSAKATKAAATKASKKSAKAQKSKGGNTRDSTRGASAKKLAARKAAKKR
jgi:hypothetical protein